MNILIITNAYPSTPDGIYGSFVREFALKLNNLGHKVVINTPAKEKKYQLDLNLIMKPLSWKTKEIALNSLNLLYPLNWLILMHFFIAGRKTTIETVKKYKISRVFCLWVIPSGLFGLWIKIITNIPYDIWALGSDIWQVKKIPLIGKYLLKKILQNADRVFADGVSLASEVESIAKVKCKFLPSVRKLPPAKLNFSPFKQKNKIHLLFVGRYHYNKGPDLLLNAISYLPSDIKKSIQLHMFGEGKLKNKLERMIINLKLQQYVNLNGAIYMQNFSNYLSLVSFLLIPSRIESIPVVFSDAIQKGIPIITTPTGDLPRLINHYKCGILAKEITPNAFSIAIEKALKTKKNNFIRGLKKAAHDFNISHTVQQWLKEL